MLLELQFSAADIRRLIGTNAAGSVALPNAASGVYVGASNNTAIGGPNGNAGTPGSRRPVPRPRS